MSNLQNIFAHCRKFNLAGVRKTLEVRLQQAQENNISYSEFLLLLLEDEKQNRDDNRKHRMYKEAHFPYEKYLDEFDFAFQPKLKKGDILELSTGKYIERAENVIFIGQPGTGKTHLSIALGIKALSQGYKVMFTSVWEMINTLHQSRADNTYHKKIEWYLKPDLLILDELGYKSMGSSTVEDFFEIVSKRYEKKSLIITSNRDFPDWDSIFVDKTLTGAIIDRLIHHCHTYTITGDSYRFKRQNTPPMNGSSRNHLLSPDLSLDNTAQLATFTRPKPKSEDKPNGHAIKVRKRPVHAGPDWQEKIMPL